MVFLFQLIALVSSRQGTKKYSPVMGLKNITIDVCRYLSGSVGSHFVDIFANDLKKYSNAFHPCPFSVRTLVLTYERWSNIYFWEHWIFVLLQGHVYFKNAIADDALFPPFLPSAVYYFDFYVFEKVNFNFKFLTRLEVFASINRKQYTLG